MDELNHLLMDGRENPVTKTNSIIMTAQDKINKLAYALDKSSTEVRELTDRILLSGGSAN